MKSQKTKFNPAVWLSNYNRPLEVSFLVIFFSAAWWWLAAHSGGPLFAEELTYLETAIQRTADPHMLNRYFHIYLLMPFLELWRDPLLAVKIFWGFLVSATGLFVYINARLLSRSILSGIIALGLFFSQWEIFRFPGVAWPEFSLMLFAVLIVTIYVLIPRTNQYRTLLLVVLGALLYLAFRTKEAGLSFAVVILGLGWVQGSQYDLKELLKAIKWIVAGAAISAILMIALDHFLMGDALFAFRPQNIKDYLKFNLISVVAVENYNLFLMYIDKLDMYNVLLLYFVSGFLLWDERSNYKKTLYLVPLAMIVVLVVSLLRGPGIMQSRYLIPLLPLLCILASLPFKVDGGEKPGKKMMALMILLLSAALIYYTLDIVNAALGKFYIHKWVEGNYFFTFVHPIALCVLLGILFFVRKFNSISIIIPLLCLIFISYPSLQNNFTHLNNKWAAGETRRHFYPFILFSDEISYSPDMLMGISTNLPGGDASIPTFSMLDMDPSSVSRMFNVFFRQRSVPEQFDHAGAVDLVSGLDDYTYVIMTYEDWHRFTPEFIEAIYTTHTVTGEVQNLGVILLSHH
jgi:hypothetical protein